MRGPAIVVLLLLTGLTTGCLSDLWDDIAGFEIEYVVLAEQYQGFSYAGTVDPTAPPGAPDDVMEHYTFSFVVPQGTTQVNVFYDILFSTGPEGGGLPPQFQQATVRLIGPAGATVADATHAETSGESWDVPTPADGTWTVELKVRGQGSFVLNVGAFVPVDP